MRLVSETEVFAQAQMEARRLVGEANDDGESMRKQVDEYVDGEARDVRDHAEQDPLRRRPGPDKLRGRGEIEALGTLGTETGEMPAVATIDSDRRARVAWCAAVSVRDRVFVVLCGGRLSQARPACAVRRRHPRPGRRPGTMRRRGSRRPPRTSGTDVVGVPEGSPTSSSSCGWSRSWRGARLRHGPGRASTGECVRCLEPIDATVEVTIQELYAYPEPRPGRRRRGRRPNARARGRPVRPRTRAARRGGARTADAAGVPGRLPGLCSECGARLADDPDHHHEAVDIRWAALQDCHGSRHEDDCPTSARRREEEK